MVYYSQTLLGLAFFMGTQINQTLLKVAKYHFDKGDVENAMKACREVCKQEKRPHSRLQAAKLILDHTRDLYKHDNPRAQKIEHDIQELIRVEFVKPDGSKGSPSSRGSRLLDKRKGSAKRR